MDCRHQWNRMPAWRIPRDQFCCGISHRWHHFGAIQNAHESQILTWLIGFDLTNISRRVGEVLTQDLFQHPRSSYHGSPIHARIPGIVKSPPRSEVPTNSSLWLGTASTSIPRCSCMPPFVFDPRVKLSCVGLKRDFGINKFQQWSSFDEQIVEKVDRLLTESM